LVDQAVNQYHFRSLVLQAGEGSYTVQDLVEIIAAIKAQFNVLIFISFGEVGLANLKDLYQAGARGLLLRFETSNPDLYQKLHPNASLDIRLEHLKYAYELGYLIITGGLIGLPGQTEKDLVNDIYLTKKLNAEMFSFGPFLPHPATSLSQYQLPLADTVLKVLSLARIIASSQTKILVTTAFETLKHNARQKGLMAGANSLMLNITPIKLRKLYELYPNRKYSVTSIQKQIDETLLLLRKLGRSPIDLG
jgi:biotin synthase